MNIIVTDNYSEMSRKTANLISAQVIMKPDCVLGLATGSTPIGTYKQLVEWYENLIEMMRLEGVSERGHLQINKNVITLLTDLHLQLLKSTKFPFYSAAYYKALPFIVELRTQGENRNLSELENCFEALYGLLLLKLQKRDISEGTLQATKAISQLLGLLSDYYKKDKAGDLELD